METDSLRFLEGKTEGYWKRQSSVFSCRFEQLGSHFWVAVLPGTEPLVDLPSKPIPSTYPEYFLNGLLGMWYWRDSSSCDYAWEKWNTFLLQYRQSFSIVCVSRTLYPMMDNSHDITPKQTLQRVGYPRLETPNDVASGRYTLSINSAHQTNDENSRESLAATLFPHILHLNPWLHEEARWTGTYRQSNSHHAFNMGRQREANVWEDCNHVIHSCRGNSHICVLRQWIEN